MSSVSSTGTSNPAAPTAGTTSASGLGDVDIDQFLKLLLTELQNQDPLNPMDNAAMLNQIGQIRQIGSTNKLTETLTNLSNGQQLAMASGLIGKKINALDVNANDVTGLVDSVSVRTDDQNNRAIQVHIGDSIVDMNNIREIITN